MGLINLADPIPTANPPKPLHRADPFAPRFLPSC